MQAFAVKVVRHAADLYDATVTRIRCAQTFALSCKGAVRTPRRRCRISSAQTEAEHQEIQQTLICWPELLSCCTPLCSVRTMVHNGDIEAFREVSFCGFVRSYYGESETPLHCMEALDITPVARPSRGLVKNLARNRVFVRFQCGTLVKAYSPALLVSSPSFWTFWLGWCRLRLTLSLSVSPCIQAIFFQWPMPSCQNQMQDHADCLVVAW